MSTNGRRIVSFDDGSLMENLHLANAFYDKNMPGEPTSERLILGPAFSLLKRIVRRATSWYVRPALNSQRLFNAHVIRSVNEIKSYLDHMQTNEDILSTIMHRDLALFRANILFLNRYFERRMLDFENEIALIRKLAGRVALEDTGDNSGGETGDALSSLDVLSLEQRIHGSPRVVQDRQRVYLEHFHECRNVLTMGCGRGELLQLLAQEGIPAKGTETDATLVFYCRDKDLDVTRADPLEYLESCEDASFDGIALSRFAGHQPQARLIEMLRLCRKKLSEGAPLVIETPNPFSLYSVAGYTLENSDRVYPLYPETLRLLCVTYGFVKPTVMFLDPPPLEENLEELELASIGVALEARQKELFHRVNQNFDKINRILFSHSDYAVVTRRGRMEAT
jgi:SAM-dependent methyltransferase